MRRPDRFSVCGRRLIVLLLIVSWACISSSQVSAHLVEYHAVVTFSDETHAAVVARFRAEPGNSVAKILLAHVGGSTLTAITVSQLNATVPYSAEESAGALLVRLPFLKSTAPLEIRYSVVSSDLLRRIPLPVVSVPPLPQERPVTVEANLPEGFVAIGEGFPALTWKNTNHGEVQSPAVPSFLVLEMERTGSVTWRSRLLTPSGLSTVGMFVLLCTGSLAWYLRTRIGEAR
jgi:hypothetical protein